MQTVRTVAAIAVVGIALLLPFPSQTLAQQTPTQQPPAKQPSVQQPPAKQTDLNETQLRSFAKAYVQILKIRQTYEPQLKQAKTSEEGKQIQKEEKSKIHQAITQEGLDEQSYNQIVDIARADDGVLKKLVGFINEEKQKS